MANIVVLPITYSDGMVLSASDLTQNFAALNSATIPYTNGGTGLTSVAAGSIIVGSSTTAWGLLTIGSSGLPLVSNGTTLAYTALGVAGGGTGLTSGTSGGVPYFSSTTAIASSGALTANALVLGGGAGAAPTVLALGTASQTLKMNSGATAPEWVTVAASGNPRSYLAGYGLANNGADAVNDIDIAVGTGRDSTNAADITLASALTKQLDAAWVVGTNQGGLDTGAIANAVYHVWAIKRSDTSVVDVLFSTSATAPTMPANYDYKRRIGSILREGATIIAFTQKGDYFRRTAGILSISTNNPGTSGVLATLGVPTGITVQALVSWQIQQTAATAVFALITDPAATDAAPSTSGTNPIPTIILISGITTIGSQVETVTDTSGRVRYRLNASDANTNVFASTIGWFDTRGRDA